MVLVVCLVIRFLVKQFHSRNTIWLPRRNKSLRPVLDDYYYYYYYYFNYLLYDTAALEEL